MIFSTIFTTSFLLVTTSKLYSAFASPIVSNDDIAAGKWLNQTHSLAKRVNPPVDSLCVGGSQWVMRRCLYTTSTVVWLDWCLGTDQHNGLSFSAFRGQCPANTMCADLNIPSTNTVDLRPTLTVVCIPIALNPVQIMTGAGGNAEQIGVVNVINPNPSNPRNLARTVSVVVRNAISSASVSALLQGTDGNYVIAPSAALVGSLRGTSTTTCNYNYTGLSCVPAGIYDLQANAIVDFTFSVQPNQDVDFYYAMLGS